MLNRIGYAIFLLSIFLTPPSFAVRCNEALSTKKVHLTADQIRERARNLAREIFSYFPTLSLGDNDIHFVVSEHFGWSDAEFKIPHFGPTFFRPEIATVVLGIKGEADWNRLEAWLGHEILHVVFIHLMLQNPEFTKALALRYRSSAGPSSRSPLELKELIVTSLNKARSSQEDREADIEYHLALVHKAVGLPVDAQLLKQLTQRYNSFAWDGAEFFQEFYEAISPQNELFVDEIFSLIRKNPSIIADSLGYNHQAPFYIFKDQVDRDKGPRPRDSSHTFDFDEIEHSDDPHLKFDGVRGALWALIQKRFKSLSIEQISQAMVTATFKFDQEQVYREKIRREDLPVAASPSTLKPPPSQADDNRLFFRIIVEKLKKKEHQRLVELGRAN
ncbi:MAG: hypothetical protein C5B49_11035 [Bdellovibrio sp.]|nr:MAG: hypothetical protein C5B49_11035 [Bdellovibrio sp.]